MKISLETILGAGGMSRYQRKKKAEQQPRDFMGRWVGAGAHVKWRSNGNNFSEPEILSGHVEKIVDGKALVRVYNPDGTKSEIRRTLLPETLGVVHSKARLPSVTTQQYDDPDNNSSQWVKDNKDKISAAEGGVRVNRADGYSVEASEDTRQKKRKDKEGNPIIYQLYAPSGRSLGVYDKEAEDSLDDIIDSDSDLVDSGGAVEVPETGPAPTTPTAPSGPAPGPMAASGAYSVPASVQEEISAALVQSVFSNENRDKAEKFCNNTQVTLEDIKFLKDALEEIEGRAETKQGKRWTNKVISNRPIRHTFDPTTYSYYSISDGPRDPVSGLIAVELETGDVYRWEVDNFFGPVATVNDFDAPYIEEVDHETAQEITYGILDNSTFRPAELYPEEENMFSLADPFIDYEMLDRFSYTPQERSADATSQARVDGKFTKVNFTPPTTNTPPVEDTKSATQEAGKKKKTTYFAIVDDVNETLIMDLIAITSANGKPVVFKRTEGIWEPDSTLQSRLNSPVPPTVVEMTDESAIKDVIKQIDEYDGVNGKKPEQALAASGYAMPDGSVRIMDVDDLEMRVFQYGNTQDLDIIRHIVSRATALNARDRIPENLLALSSFKSSTPIMGTYGEVIVASATDRSPLEALQRYWLFGPHSDYIGWGTEGDVDRASVYLNKYLGSDRAQAFALSLRGLSPS